VPRAFPLSGLTVLDLSRLVPGPYATMMLADLGARVIKIEQPEGGDPMRSLPGASPAFENLNRNKESVTLDLRRGREVLLRLARRADVLVEGFRPGVVDRLGIGYRRVARVNPRIVYCSISGYGQSGPLRDEPGHDVNYLARSGLLDATGPPGGEPTIPALLSADLAGGALMSLVGILSALLERERTRRGQYLDVAMLDGLLSLAFLPACYWMGGEAPPRRGRLPLTGGLARYGVYRAKDARHVSLGCLEPKFWTALCERLGLPDLLRAPAGARAEERARARIGRVLRRRRAADWERLPDLPVAAVRTMGEALRDPHVRHRGMVRRVGGLLQMAFPVRFSRARIRRPARAPRLGEHTEAMLRSLGYSPRERREMRRLGVV
jgi:alpha-methylacyl-CoA racemase